MAGNILEARVTYDFLNNEKLFSGVIHSKFNSAINMLFSAENCDTAVSGRLLTIVRNGSGGIPDSLTIGDGDFDRLLEMMPVGGEVYKGAGSENFRFAFPDMPPDADVLGADEFALSGGYSIIRSSSIPVRHCEVASPMHEDLLWLFPEVLVHLNGKTGAGNGFSDFDPIMKAETEKHLEEFCASLILSDGPAARRSAYSIAGAGKGLTPAADDALIGVMAVYTGAVSCGAESRMEGRKRHKTAAPGKCLTDVVCDITRLDDILFGRTTDVSMKYLRCAQEGRFSDAMTGLACALYANNADRSAAVELLKSKIASVAAYGATSGVDMLAGVAAAVRVMIRFNYGRRDEGYRQKSRRGSC